MKTVWAYAHVGSNPTLSAKKVLTIRWELFWQIHRIRTRGRLETCRGHVSTRGGLRRSAGRIPYSPPKNVLTVRWEHFFADKQDSNPRVRIKQESLTPALLYLCTENILPGGVLNSSRHRAFGARYFVSQMTLRTVCVSPPASIPKQVLPNVPLFVPKPGSRYSDVGSGVSQFRKRLANTHGGYLNNRSGSRPPNK